MRTKIVLCVTTLATVVFACAALLLWNTDRSSFHHKRSIHACEEIAHLLRLSGAINGTFRQIHTDLVDRKTALTLDLDEAASRIDGIIRKIGQGAPFDARAEVPPSANRGDVDSAYVLRRAVNQAFRDVREAQRLIAVGRDADASYILEHNLGPRFHSAIDRTIEDALAAEGEKLADALHEIEKIDGVAVWAAAAAAIAGLLLTALLVFILVLRLKNSLITLEAGAEIFAAGNLSHEIPVHGYDEFAALSRRLNSMARQLRKQHVALEEARTSLECRVAERTGELMTANAELERRDAMRRQFFADIGHELRTPITAVRGEAEVALRTRQDKHDSYRSALTRIVKISDQLTRFVNDVFLIAREQAGVADMRCDKIDLKEVVTCAVAQMRALIDHNDVTMSIELMDDPARMEGDTQRLCQLVHILLSNAIQHSPAGVNVAIGIRKHGEFWALNVRDDGSGIPAGEIAHVFDRFYRGSSSAGNDCLQGTGLGLPIARSIVQAHGGRIWIDPDYRNGTSVLAVFPILNEKPNDLPIPEVTAQAVGVMA